MSNFFEGITKSLDQASGKSSLYWGWCDKGDGHYKSIPQRSWQVTTATGSIQYRREAIPAEPDPKKIAVTILMSYALGSGRHSNNVSEPQF